MKIACHFRRLEIFFVACFTAFRRPAFAAGSGTDLVPDDNSLFSASEILLKLYDETRGLRWDKNVNWLQDTDVCSWYGVTCYDESVSDQRRVGHIQKLDLSANRLLGTIPAEVFQLPYLESIDVRNNADLTVAFGDVGDAQYLKEIAISSTNTKSLEGIKSALRLESLHITSLGLTGSIPAQVFELGNLEGLFANYNKFTGSLPFQIGQLTRMKELYLFGSDLTGQLPSELGLLRNLQVVTLAENAFGGTLPTELNECTKLSTLAINRASGFEKKDGIKGVLLSFNKLRDITDLRLQNQHLSGEIPVDFLASAPMQEVVKVDLSGNGLTGTVPEGLTKLKRLNLFLADNQIRSVPRSICNNAGIASWLSGNVGALGCDGFLCPPGHTASLGRATPGEACIPCDGLQNWGSTQCASSITASMGYSEREVLISAYNALNGKFWANDEGWLDPSVDICEWYGVECVSGKVTGLFLKNNEMSNFPPAELFSLPELKHINFEDNSIDFRFKGVGQATKLESLLLSGCDLTSLDDLGEIGATAILKLSLSSNHLKGEIPDALFDVTTLQELDLSHNSFSGQLPSRIGLLTNLEELLFPKNQFHGQIPSTLGNLVRLKKLIGSDNEFTGSLPEGLSLLTQLEILSLHQTNTQNGIGGPLLSLRNLGQLTSLHLDSNNLSGVLPDDFLRYTEKSETPIEVRLCDNKFTGSIPDAWASRFQELLIDLSGNMIVDMGTDICSKGKWNHAVVQQFSCDAILCAPGTFNEIGRQTGADAICRPCLHAASVKYYGSKSCNDGEHVAPKETSELALLKDLFDATGGYEWENRGGWMLSNDPCSSWYGVECNAEGKAVAIELESNHLHGSTPSSIFQLSELRSLSLMDNQISFNFEGIDKASNLAILKLSGTNLNSVAGVYKATGLVELHLSDNKITGTFPHEILALTNLRRLYMNFNQISGKLPPEITALKHCEDLFIFNNRLSGQLPASIGLLTNLKHLSLAENSFRGTLPIEINDLTNLEILSLQRKGGTDTANVGVNQGTNDDLGAGIGGPLPPLDNLKYLKKLYLGSNSLTGVIPFNFLNGINNKALPIEIDLVSNQLTGSIPPSLTQFDDLSLFVAGNMISGIADGLCRKDAWMGGAVSEYRCDAILCPPGTFSVFGRQRDTYSVCASCGSGTSSNFYGSFNCFGEDVRQSWSERNILEDVYMALEGEGWRDSMKWLDLDESFCDWTGVTCVNDEESVASISLPGNGLKGSMPTEVFELPNLKELNLAQNPVDLSLSGIGSAGKLEYLQLDDTNIRSLVGLEHATGLKLLHLANNNITSESFTNVASLTSLESLDLSRNDVSPFPSLASLGNLKYLACSECGISGPIPSWLTALTHLEHVDLEGNSLTGELPSSISNLSGLRFLNVADQFANGGNGLGGGLPNFIGMAMLTELYLQRNKISGTLPSSLLQNVSGDDLITVDLRSNALNGSIPEELTHITHLSLYLAANQIESIPESVCATNWNEQARSDEGCDHILCAKGTFNALGRATPRLPCAACTDASFASFLGSTECGASFEKNIVYGLFEGLGGRRWKEADGWQDHDDHCSWLGITCYSGGFRDGFVQKIELAENGLMGTLDTPIWELVHLNILDLRKNDIVVPFDAIANAQSLEMLQLSETKVSTLEGLSAAPNLKHLHLTNCEIAGGIPNDLYSMTQLRSLYLNYNELTGTLSSSIGRLSQLSELYLFHNRMNGTLPAAIGMLEAIEILSLGENKFTGPIPMGLNSLQHLRVLSLQREEIVHDTSSFFMVIKNVGLRGDLVPFNNTPKLRELYLGNNHLEGDIPLDFLRAVDDTSSTIRVDLSSNMLHGAIPASLVRFDDLRVDLTGNNLREVPQELCSRAKWFDGELGSGCDALLCPPGTYNEYGRRIGSEGCEQCAFRGSAVFYGSRMCGALMPQMMSDSYMLQEVYASTGGLSWINSENWLREDVSVCEWYGVTCNDQRKVSELSLEDNNLVGLVPSIVFYLPSLTKLNLGRNKVWVQFNDIQYSSLEELVLHETNVASLDGISNAVSLKMLDLKKSTLSGKHLPEELFDLANLTVVELSQCGLTSTIPSGIGNWKNLVTLLLDRNELSGQIPSEVGKLTKLQDLFLSDNQFFGTLPAQMDGLIALKSLFLDAYNENRVGISGPLLSFAGMPKLRELHLGSNSLTGTIPSDLLSGIEDFNEVVTVDIASNHLTGTIPAQFSVFEKLNLIVTDNYIESIDHNLCSKSSWLQGAVGSFSCDGLLCPVGTFNSDGRQSSKDSPCMPCAGKSLPPYMGQLSCLTDDKDRERHILDIVFQALGGETWTNNDGWLREDLDYCSWYGITCSDSTIESISLGGNNLIGTLPEEVWGLRNLKHLWLYSNPIEFKFDGIGKASGLRNLRLDSTGLKSLEGLGGAKGLVEVDVRFNRLEGELLDLSSLEQLESFSCAANDLSGSLPSFASNKKLSSLRVGANSFTGSLPSFASHPALRTLDVSDNAFVGPIPDNLLANADTFAKVFLDLSSNGFTGAVPESFTRFSDLTIYLRDNYIDHLPASLCSMEYWNQGDVGLAGCDGILCPPKTFATATGRASRGGSNCKRCDEAQHFGSTTCADHSSGASLVQMGAGLIACVSIWITI